MGKKALEDFFSDEIIEDDESFDSNDSLDGGGRHGKRNEALFEGVKTRMVMRIYGVSPEKAREIIASRVTNARDAAEDSGDRL